MNNNERVARLERLLESFNDERMEYFENMSTDDDIKREYNRGRYETMLSVIRRITSALNLEEVC